MIKDAIKEISYGNNLDLNDMQEVFDEIMDGNASGVEIASLLTGLSVKQETIDEIIGAAKSMKQHALKFPVKSPTLDIVGTGGDKVNSFNISTTVAIIVSSLGIPVTKHGNRVASSKSGAADVLQTLGFNINLTEVKSQKMLDKYHFAFLFAQKYHESMKYAAPVRKELGFKTIFNILGPLCNPSNASSQLLGVYDEKLLIPLAKVLKSLNIKNANIIFGIDGMDEASISSPTKVVSLVNNKILEKKIEPKDFGLNQYPINDISGGTPQENADIIINILNGEKGARREIVLLNAGLAINSFDLNITIKEGINLARESIDNMVAKEHLQQIIKFSREE